MLASSSCTALRRVGSRVNGIASRVLPDATRSGAGHVRSMAIAHGQQPRGDRRDRQRTDGSLELPEGRLRGQPYRNAPSTQFRGGPGSSLARFNLQLANVLTSGKMNIATGLRIACEMKEAGIRPDLTTFHHLLRGFAHHGLFTEAVACVDEMERLGIVPDQHAFHYILQAAAWSEMGAFWKVLGMMTERGLEANEATYEALIQRHCAASNLEHALQSMADLQNKGLNMTLGSAQALVDLACRLGNSRLALDLAQNFDKSSFRRLEGADWMNVLTACVEDLYADGVVHSWHEVVNQMGIVPDEGTCILVLNTAARHGLYVLADEAIRTLRSLQVPWREVHFAPLIEACARAGRLQDAFGVLALMRAAGVAPEPTTASPLVDAIRTDADAIDAAWAVLDEMHERGRPVDPVALDVLVQAAVALGDLQRALGVYKGAGALGITPGAATFNTLLAGCVAARHRELGDTLLSEMRAAGVTADAGTYEALIALCLTQDNYEDAFFYLEEMKSQGHRPPAPVYEAIVRTCAGRQDTRYEIALEEMTQCGYAVSNDLRNFIHRHANGRGDSNEMHAPAQSVMDGARMFQNSEYAGAGVGGQSR